MRSRVHIANHPVHPMLIAFPIAFLSGAFGFDLLGVCLDNPSLWTTGGYLLIAGIIAAVVAAVPGIIDYAAVVPPKSVGKKDAALHGIVNCVALVLFIVAACLRHGWPLAPTSIVLVLEGIAFLVLGYGGWLGGEVAYVDHIGVQKNYANSGEWTEEHVQQTAGGTPVAEAGELQVDQMKLIHIGGKRIVLVRNADGYSAFGDRCPHQGGSLADGAAICGTVQCPWHGSQFDTQTGAVKKGPATSDIPTYPVDVKNGKIFLV
jgi:nitrite reductase/ring-hydroxylating ferredoxin subunit/uncharacterized membrane protein